MRDDSGLREHQVTVGDSSLRVVEAGEPGSPPVVFLHGWPQTADAWRSVMAYAAAEGWHAVAFHLPGVGGSTGDATDGSAWKIAGVVDELLSVLGLDDVVLVGHDVGGMTAYAYLRGYAARRVVIMDTVVPGVPPWEQVLANPYV